MEMFVYKKSSLLDIVVLVFINSYILAQATDNKSALLFSVCSILFAAIFPFIIYKKCKVVNKSSIITIFCVAFYIVLFIMANDNLPKERLVFYGILSLSSLILAYHAGREFFNIQKVINIQLGLVFFLLLSFKVYAILNTMPLYAAVSIWLKGFSYNYISAHIIILLALKIVIDTLKNERVGFRVLLISSIAFYFCVELYGRSGIFFSFLILVAVAINFMRDRGLVVVIFSSFLLVVFIVILWLNVDIIIDLLNETKFKEGVDSPRTLMLDEYFSNFDLYSFVFGKNLHDTVLIKSFNFNPHNSYLNGHVAFGVIGVIFNVVILCMILAVSIKRSALIIFMIMVVLGRAFFDVLIFPGIFDFIIYGIFFLIFNKRSFQSTALLPEKRC